MSVTYSYGAQQDLNWYLITSIHPVGDGYGNDAERRYAEFRRAIAQRAEVVYEVPVRVIPNYPASTILNVPTGNKTLYQMIFGTHKYSDGWTKPDLIQTIDSTPVNSLEAPYDKDLVLDMLVSVWSKHLLHTSDGVAWLTPDQYYSDQAPMPTDGNINDIRYVAHDGVIDIYVRTLIWERLDAYLTRTGKALIVQQPEPAISADLWLNLGNGVYRIYDQRTNTYSSGITYYDSLPGAPVVDEFYMTVENNYRLKMFQYDGAAWVQRKISNSLYRASGYGDLIYQDTYELTMDETALFGGPISEGGMIEVYNNDCSAGNLVAATTKLIWTAGATDKPYLDVGTCAEGVFIGPPPSFRSHYNKGASAPGGNADTAGAADGTNDAGVANIPRTTVRVAAPSGGEGFPFFTSGWANTNQAGSNDPTVVLVPLQECTGFGGDSSFDVEVRRSSGGALLAKHTITNIAGNSSQTLQNITIAITLFGPDAGSKFKALPTVTVDVGTIFSSLGETSGRYYIVCTHVTDSTTDGAGIYTKKQELFFDKNQTTPTVAGGTTIIQESTVPANIITKHLSGIEYYTTGSEFEILVSDIDQHNREAARTAASLLLRAADYGLPPIDASPFGTDAASFTGFTIDHDLDNQVFNKLDWAINAASYRYAGPGGNGTAQPQDPWASGASQSSPNMRILVDTYVDSSTNLVETFDSETRRLQADYATAWDSTLPLAVGDALVYGGSMQAPSRAFLMEPQAAASHGGTGAGGSLTDFTLYKPDKNGANPDYTALTVPVAYIRRFVDTGVSRANFTMTFTGVFAGGTALNDLVSGALQVFLYKNAGLGNVGVPPLNVFPIWLHGAVGYNAGDFNDGNPQVNAQSTVRLGTSAGNIIQGTFGGYNMQQGVHARIVITNPAIRIDSIAMTFA